MARIRICLWCGCLVRPAWSDFHAVCGFEGGDDYEDYDALWIDLGGEGGGA